jgi:hypothetical protein
MFQLREAQDSVPPLLFKTIINAEQTVLSCLFTSSQLPVGLAFITVWKTMNYQYIRFVDHGVLTGLCEQLWCSWGASQVIADRIASTTDIQRLSTMRRQRKVAFANKAFACVNEIAAKKHSKLSTYLVVVDFDGEHIRHVAHGQLFQGESHIDLTLRHTLQPDIDQDHMSTMRSLLQTKSRPYKLQDQLAVLNCLPNIDLSFSSSSNPGLTVREGRFRNSCKSLMIRGESSVEVIHATAVSDHVFRRKGVPNTSHTSDSEPWAADILDTKDNDSDTIQEIGARAPLVMSLVDKFKFLMRQGGIVRIRHRSESQIEVIWNKFDSVKGEKRSIKNKKVTLT